jgi:hypothetical protein
VKYATNVSTIEGGHVTGDDLILKANDTDAYPLLTLEGNSVTRLRLKSGAGLYVYDEIALMAYLAYSGGYTYLKGGNTAGDSLDIRANFNDLYARINLEGNANIKNYFKSGSAFYLYADAVQAFKQSYAANVSTLEGGHVTGDDLILKANDTYAYPKIELLGNSDINLKTNNAAKYISFGVYSALGAEVLAGFITIKDEAGNLRKVAVVA